MPKRYWLLKSEPDTYSIDSLKKDRSTQWDGVRNYQARNFLRDELQVGDEVLFYHSSTKPAAVVGTATVVKSGYPDPTQFNKRSKYYDQAATKDSPRWFVVDVRYQSKFANPVTLDAIKATPSLADMVLVKRGRLSVQPVTAKQWKIICKMGSR